MRLRPSGNAGPIASGLAGFRPYQEIEAWTWEHLALSRARVIVADGGMGDAVDAVIAAQMATTGDIPKRIEDVVSMRALMARERPARQRRGRGKHHGAGDPAGRKARKVEQEAACPGDQQRFDRVAQRLRGGQRHGDQIGRDGPAASRGVAI